MVTKEQYEAFLSCSKYLSLPNNISIIFFGNIDRLNAVRDKKTLTILLTFFLPKMAGRQALFRHDNCYSVGACSCFWQKLQLLMPSENVRTFFSSNEFSSKFLANRTAE